MIIQSGHSNTASNMQLFGLDALDAVFEITDDYSIVLVHTYSVRLHLGLTGGLDVSFSFNDDKQYGTTGTETVFLDNHAV